MDTFTTAWNRVLLRVPAAGPDLAQDLVRDGFNQLVERRQWSWRMRTSSFYAPQYTPVGQITVASGSAIVTGTGTAFTAAMTGIQIRLGAATGSLYPIYTISQVTGPLGLVLDRPWIGPPLSNQAYSIYQCYFPVPADFDSFYSVVNTAQAYRLNHNATQAELNLYDPQRTQSGIAYALAFLDYTQTTTGTIAPALQVHGSGGSPVSTTSLGFSYPGDSVYSIEITLAGAAGVAQFRWAQDSGITSGSNVLTGGLPIDLSNGVQVYFPTAAYNLGDVFVIACKAQSTAGVPRYEMWPKPVGVPNTYPYTYVARTPALSDDQPGLPAPIARRGDVLVEMALAALAIWPGTATQPNPYHDLGASSIHRISSEKIIYELETRDDETAVKDLTYDYPHMGPWGDGSWLQTHAIYPY